MRHNVGLYLRVSTEEQAQVIEGSLDSQRHRLHGFVDIKNMQETGWGKVIETYTDEGLSAKDTRRPAFQRMLKDIRAGKINLILVTDLSRLSRNILDFCILLEDLKKYNAKFLSLKEQFDTSTPAGEMMVFNMINLAQFERKQTSERVAINFHARALRGLRNGGSALLGFDRDPNDPSRYVLNEHEASHVRRIFEVYRQEMSLTRTLEQITSEGIRQKPQKKKNGASGNEWCTSTLRRALRNFAYAGLREVNAKNKGCDPYNLKAYEKYQIVKASWDPLVCKSDFDCVQNILDENLAKERSRRGSGKRRTFFLTGIIYCEECGRPLLGSSGSGRNETFRYYVHAPHTTIPSTCQLKTISANDLEQKVLNHLDEVLFREGYLDSIEKRMEFVYHQKSNDVEVGIAQAKANIDQINYEIQGTLKLLTKMANQGVDDLLAESLKKLNQQKITTESELEDLKSRVQEPLDAQLDRKVIEVRATELKRAKSKATPAMIKRLLHKVVAGIVINTEKAKVAYWGTEDSDSMDIEAKKMAASDKSSGAATITAPAGRRKLELVQSFQGVPPLFGEVESDHSAGSYVVKNGWGARIRTLEWRNQNPLAYHLPTPQQLYRLTDNLRNNIDVNPTQA